MVFCTLRNYLPIRKPTYTGKYKVNSFLDTLLINVKGGQGGQGLHQYGGVGGRGGNVYLVADDEMTLAKLRKNTLEKQKKLLFKAGNGLNSRKQMLLGHPGQDTEVPVPKGVMVSNQNGQFIGEVLEQGEKLLVAKGGDGAQLSNNFLSGKGHYQSIILDLKLIADIGLVGFPNAGKSSLLKALSNAKPKIKPYPFTTISPQIGVMQYKDTRQITVADLPGLVEGAHMNIGMGHDFLKHMERTKLLLFVIDLHGFQFKIHMPNRNAFESVVILLKEMELAKSELLSKPAVLAINKIDLPQSEELAENIKEKVTNMEDYFNEVEEEWRPTSGFKFDDIITISARNGINITDLKDKLRIYLDVHDDKRRELELENHKKDSLEKINAQISEQSSTVTWI